MSNANRRFTPALTPADIPVGLHPSVRMFPRGPDERKTQGQPFTHVGPDTTECRESGQRHSPTSSTLFKLPRQRKGRPMSLSLKQSPVLLLNASYEPINICSAKRALALVVNGKARLEVEGERLVRVGMRIPSVIRLVEHKRIPHRSLPLTRKGIFQRDRFQCQYCLKALTGDDLTLDHVLPSSRGGLSTWENLVACCKRCNRKKGSQLPSECEPPMVLARKPRPVTIHTSRALIRQMGAEDAAWRKYLYYDSAA